MRLLYIVIGLANEGISNTLIQRLNYLSENTDFELHVLSERTNSEVMVRKLNSGIQVHSLNLKNLEAKRRLPFFGYFSLRSEGIACYQKFIDDLQPHIITAFDLESHYKEAVPLLKTDAKRIIEIHGSFLGSRLATEYKKRKKREIPKKKKHLLDLFRPSNREIHNLYDYAVVLTKEDMQDRTYLKIPIVQIYNSVVPNNDITEFMNRENIIVAVGRLVKDKNFEDLVLAVSKIKHLMNNWQIHIYGDGQERASLEKLICQEGLQNIVFLKGTSLNMPNVYNNAKLLISTSLTEGFGRTLLEGLYFKIPVISYDFKCGAKEIICHEQNGFLVNFDVEDLANKILQLISNPELLQSFSEHTWDQLDRFDFKTNMNEWVDLYRLIGSEIQK